MARSGEACRPPGPGVLLGADYVLPIRIGDLPASATPKQLHDLGVTRQGRRHTRDWSGIRDSGSGFGDPGSTLGTRRIRLRRRRCSFRLQAEGTEVHWILDNRILELAFSPSPVPIPSPAQPHPPRCASRGADPLERAGPGRTRRAVAEREPLFGAAIGARPPAAAIEPLQLVARRAGAQRARRSMPRARTGTGTTRRRRSAGCGRTCGRTARSSTR